MTNDEVKAQVLADVDFFASGANWAAKAAKMLRAANTLAEVFNKHSHEIDTLLPREIANELYSAWFEYQNVGVEDEES